MELLIVFGFAAFFTWYLLVIVGIPGYFPAGDSSLLRRVVQAAAFVGLIGGAVFAMGRPQSFEVKGYSVTKAIGWGIAGALVPVAVMLQHAGLSIPFPLAVALYLVSGVCAGFFFTGWENLTTRGRVRDTLIHTGAVMAAGCLVYLMIAMFMMPLAQGAMGVFLIAVSAVLFYSVSLKRFPREPKDAKKGAKRQGAEQEVEEAPERHRGVFNLKLSALLLATNLPLGFALSLLYGGTPAYLYATLGFATLAVMVFLVLICVMSREFSFTMLLRASAAVSVLCLLFMAFANDYGFVSVTVLFASWLLFRLAHSGTMLRLTGVQKVEPVYLMVRGKLPAYVGFLAGFLVGMVVIASSFDATVCTGLALLLTAVLVIALIVCLPISEDYAQQLDRGDEKAATTFSPEASEHEKCAQLARVYNLSPREEEVLFFIVKGRNAKYISEKLVISESTAKTHIHNIYKKSGVHSQQKFIDLMDEML